MEEAPTPRFAGVHALAQETPSVGSVPPVRDVAPVGASGPDAEGSWSENEGAYEEVGIGNVESERAAREMEVRGVGDLGAMGHGLRPRGPGSVGAGR